MGLKVIEQGCQHEGDRAIIMVESDLVDLGQAIEEVQSMDARNLAVQHAASRLSPPIVNPRVSMTHPDYFPVDGNGKEIAMATPGVTPARYRSRIPVVPAL